MCCSVCPDHGTEETREEAQVEGGCEVIDSSDSQCDDSFEGESVESESDESDDNDSLYIPTPSCQDKVHHMDVPNKLDFIPLPQLVNILELMNNLWAPGCTGSVVPVHFDSLGLGGTFSVTCCCDRCFKGMAFDTSMKHESLYSTTTAVGMSVQIAFIIVGCTHAVYYKTLKLALGIDGVSMSIFMNKIRCMYPVVKAMLDGICEAAKKEIKINLQTSSSHGNVQ